jgi:hypothetical protein
MSKWLGSRETRARKAREPVSGLVKRPEAGFRFLHLYEGVM